MRTALAAMMVLALAALLLMRDITIPPPKSRRIEPAARTATPATGEPVV